MNLKRKVERAAAIILSLILTFSLIPNIKAQAGQNDWQYFKSDYKELSFDPAGIVEDEKNPVIYMSDSLKKRVVAYNYKTKKESYIQLDIQPESLAFAGGYLYVSLLKGSHDAYNFGPQSGAIAVIDPATFSTSNPVVKERFDIDTDPFSIAVDPSGYLYVSSGSGQWTELKSYDLKTKKKLSGKQIYHKQKIAFDKANSRVYSVENSSPSSIVVYPAKLGILEASYELSEDKTGSGDFKVSPDGQYLITGYKNIYALSGDRAGDLVLVKNMGPGHIRGIEFDMVDRYFYVGENKFITAYDYDKLLPMGNFHAIFNVKDIFYNSGTVAALTQDSNEIYYIETLVQKPLAKCLNYLSSSIEDGAMNVPLVDEIDLYFDKSPWLAGENAVSIKDGQGNHIKTTFLTEGNTLRVLFEEKLKHGKKYTLTVDAGGVMGSDNYISYPESIKIEFTTGNESTLTQEIKQYIPSNIWIKGEKSYSGDMIVGNKNVLTVKPGATLNVKGDLIVYGSIINYGSINVSGKIYARPVSELDPFIRQGSYSYFVNRGSYKGTLVPDFPDNGFVVMTPDSDITQSGSTQNFEVITYPGSNIYLNDQLYKAGSEIYNVVPVSLRKGDNKVKIKVTGSFKNAFEKEVTVNSTQSNINVISTYPQDIASEFMPVNTGIFLRFDSEVTADTGFSNIKIVDNKTKGTYLVTSQIEKDGKGTANILTIYPNNDLAYSTSYTLTVPYNAVKAQGNINLEKDYTLSFSTDNEFKRLAGQDRYGTSVEISKEGWKVSENVVLATGDNFPDALSAAPFARKLGAPILLTDSKVLSQNVFDEIKRLGAKNVYIIGGLGAVSASAQVKLEANGIKCERIQGKDRYETSAAIANKMGMSKTIVVATGNNFPDALSIAPFAAAMQAPILLTDNSIIPGSIKNYITGSGAERTLVIGGTGVISDKLMGTLPGPERLAGKDRYETNFEIISKLEADPTYTFFATGENFPDALAGSTMASYLLSPIVLVDRRMNMDVLEDWKYNKGIMKMKYVLGGTGAVPQDVINSIFLN